MNNLDKAIKIIKSKSYLAFDFDGVIADSFEIKKIAFSKLYMKYGNEIANKVLDFHEHGHGGMSRVKKFQFFHKNFLNIELNDSQVRVLCSEFSKLVMKSVADCPEISGVSQFLKTYYKHKKFIVNSATPQDEMKQIIVDRGLNNLFSGIYGSPITKEENFKKIFFDHNIKPKDLVFFGDLNTDFFAAEIVGCDFIGIGDRIDFDLITSTSTNRYAFLSNFENI